MPLQNLVGLIKELPHGTVTVFKQNNGFKWFAKYELVDRPKDAMSALYGFIPPPEWNGETRRVWSGHEGPGVLASQADKPKKITRSSPYPPLAENRGAPPGFERASAPTFNNDLRSRVATLEQFRDTTLKNIQAQLSAILSRIESLERVNMQRRLSDTLDDEDPQYVSSA